MYKLFYTYGTMKFRNNKIGLSNTSNKYIIEKMFSTFCRLSLVLRILNNATKLTNRLENLGNSSNSYYYWHYSQFNLNLLLLALLSTQLILLPSVTRMAEDLVCKVGSEILFSSTICRLMQHLLNCKESTYSLQAC